MLFFLFFTLHVTADTLVATEINSPPTPPALTQQTFPLQGIDVYYKDGVNFRYDSVFSMQMKFRIQNRYSFEDYDSRDSTADKSEFLTRRVRLRFEGHVLDPKLTYKIQLSFSRQDMDYDNAVFPNILRDANVGYQFTKNDKVIVGLGKLPGNRQRVISSGQQEFVDRTISNALLNLDRDVGIQWWHRFGEIRPLWLKLAVSNGQGRGSSQEDNGMSYTYRAEWLPLGTFRDEGDYFEGDIAFEETAKISMAAGMNFNKKANRTNGQLGVEIADGDGRDMESFIADLLIKYRGWAWSSEYFRRNSERPEVNASQTLFDGQAWSTQLSYTFRNMYFTGARWAETLPDEAVENLIEKEDQYSVTFGRYFNKHTVKLLGDVSYLPTYSAATGTTRDNWAYRVQLELGI